MRKLIFCAIAAATAAATVMRTDAEPIHIEVIAKLTKIPGKLPPDDLYDYVYVMQYRVQGGKLDGKRLLVAHYKPRRPREKIKDKMRKHISGTLKRFIEGAIHKLTLTPLTRRVWKGAVVDEFFAADRKSLRYFCLKADRAVEKE